MPVAKSKAELRRMRTTNLQQNISQAVKRTYDTIRDSPKKLMRAFTSRSPPHKRTRTQTTGVAHSSTASSPSSANDATDASDSEDPLLRPYITSFLVDDTSGTPTQPPESVTVEWDLSDPFRDVFSVDAANQGPATAAAASKCFNWKPASVEEVPDDDDSDTKSDVPSTATFPFDHPEILRQNTPMSSPSDSFGPFQREEIDFDPRDYVNGFEDSDYGFEDSDSSSHAASPPISRSPSPVPSDELEYVEEEMDEQELAEFEAELRALQAKPADTYQRPGCTNPAILQGQQSGADADGIHRRAPQIADARAALAAVSETLRGKLRGNKEGLFGKDGVGYEPPKLDPFTHSRLWGIRALLSLYTDEDSATFNRWGDSMLQAAIAMHRGKHCARMLASLTRQYIINRELLELNPYGKWTESMLMDEDLASDVKLFLQSLKDEITSEKLRDYLRDPEVKRKHGIERDICIQTACRYLKELGYRFQSPKVGQYVDGHERPDVVEYRDNVYLPAYFKLQERVWVFDNDGEPVLPTPAGRRVIFWYHDESIFYAHDRRRKTWVHKNSSAKPYKKGEGYSYMVADFFSADFGWLRNPWTGKSARVCIKPGVNRDGYFTNVEVREQAKTAVDLVNELWPQYEHVFIYDNATTHRKRPDSALSALKMPKAPSGSNSQFPDANIMGKRNKRGPDGKPIYSPDGKIETEDVPMIGAKLPNGDAQDLYFPAGHLKAGKFKGMQIVLEERGIQAKELRTQCPKFKCKDTSETAACCCRRILFNQPDFVNVQSMLEEECAARGVQVLFTPRFHCELNPIEMVWGYSKRLYRLNPESGKQEDLERNTIEAIDGVPLLFMRRFVNRSHRFADGYFNMRLSGPEVAWAAKKYHGHRTFPNDALEQLLKAGL